MFYAARSFAESEAGMSSICKKPPMATITLTDSSQLAVHREVMDYGEKRPQN
jgi:hypothetical protein